MQKAIGLSGVALSVLMLAAPPASAQLLSLGGGADGNAAISVNIGGGGGGSGLPNVGGHSKGDARVLVQVRLGKIDLDGDGILDGTLLDIDGDGIGDFLDLDGDGVGDRKVHVRLSGVGKRGQTQLAIGTDKQDEVVVNLFGAKGKGRTLTTNILPGGTHNLLSDEDAEATVSLGDNDVVVVDLFGKGGGGGAGGGVDVAVIIDLFGGGGDGGPGGTPGSGGGNGVDPTETGSIGGGGDGTGGVSVGTRVAATGDVRARTSCFTPTDEQIAHLVARNSYGAGVAASWRSATAVSLVPVRLCSDARARLAAALAANGNIGVMRKAVAMTPLITAKLAPEYQPDDVLAVDQSGKKLTVYVY